VEDPKLAKGIVKREVVDVATPGTAMSEQFLQAKEANYLLSVKFKEGRCGLGMLDVSTGEFRCLEFPRRQLEAFLRSLAPREVLVSAEEEAELPAGEWLVSPLEPWIYHLEFARNELLKHFSTRSLSGFGLEDVDLAASAAGSLIYYLRSYQGRDLGHVTRIQLLHQGDWMTLDSDTLRNLELFESLGRRGRGALIHTLDETVTAAGGRLLRDWIRKPLLDQGRIQQRQELVQQLLDAPDSRASIRDLLKSTSDMERLLARLNTGRASPRDLAGLRDTLGHMPIFRESLAGLASPAAFRAETLPDLSSLVKQLEEILVEDPPVSPRKGGLIRDGVDPGLDDIRALARDAQDWLTRFQARERERLGIPTLKVGFNKVFGYFIEITHTHKERVPDEYTRKQTLVNSERYITPELKEYEEKVLTAEERYTARELELFEELRQETLTHATAIQDCAAWLARLDVVTTFAQQAFDRHFCRPEIDASLSLEIRGGRHPVIEETLPVDEAFIPNDLFTDADGDQILLITGPNMAGKSTYLRQTGLIVLMAQMGAFVPAEEARIGLVDRIFTRVGASDNLAGGESTFMVEMNETANILNNATRRSLVLLDEIGRGTSTYDGLAIAWALVEFLHNEPQQAARTLFATHYHELTALESVLERVRNYNVAVREYDEQIVFLRKIIPGAADRSYGIHVAQMAGVPLKVIQRANEILSHLDENESVDIQSRVGDPGTSLDSNQLSLFEVSEQRLRKRLADVDINRLTPLDAMLLVDELLREMHGEAGEHKGEPHR